jgi:ribosomal protein L29
MKVTMKEIRVKEATELDKMITESRTELRQLKTKAGAQDLKNVRSIRHLKKLLSRLNTRLTELKKQQGN